MDWCKALLHLSYVVYSSLPLADTGKQGATTGGDSSNYRHFAVGILRMDHRWN